MSPPEADNHAAERGSLVPFVLLSFLIALVMVCGGITASVGFLEQRDVQSLCDGAAVAAANAVDEGRYFATSGQDAVPLSQESVNSAMADYLTSASEGLDAWSTSTDGRSVEVVCTRFVVLPFAALFLGGNEVERTAVASARSPFSP